MRVGEDLLAALAHAHARGVVHRDVKPANVLIGPDGRARLSDFGVARLSGEAGLTMTGGVVGTIAYMAPEQALGEGASPAADVFAACLVVYEGLTGANPNAGATPAETARRAAAGRRAAARARPPRPARRASRAPSTRASTATRSRARPPPSWPGRWPRRAAAWRSRRRRRGVRALPTLASAAGGAALAGAGLAAAAGRLAQRMSADWRPASRRSPSSAAAPLFAWRPRAAALLAVIGGGALVGLASPAAGALLAAVALAVVPPAGGRAAAAAAGRRAGPVRGRPRAALPRPGGAGAALARPPLGGRGRRGRRRGLAVAAGAGGVLAGGDPLPSAVGPLDGGSSPADAGRALWQPLADRPQAGVQALPWWSRRCACRWCCAPRRAARAWRPPRSGWRRWAPRWSRPPPTPPTPWAP